MNVLYKETQSNNISWEYNDDETSVYTSYLHFGVLISYHFDSINEVGVYKISIEDRNERKFYGFSSSQYENGFDSLSLLFDLAQSSDFKFDFGSGMGM